MKLEFEKRLHEEAKAAAEDTELLKSQDQMPSMDQLLTVNNEPEKI